MAGAAGWGAWEIAGRVSTMNLNDQLGTTNGVAGGPQTICSAGLNWYVNSNIRFMFGYLHGDIPKQVSPTNTRIPARSSTHSGCVRRLPSEPLGTICHRKPPGPSLKLPLRRTNNLALTVM